MTVGMHVRAPGATASPALRGVWERSGVTVVQGLAPLAAVAGELDLLVACAGTPVTASSTWVLAHAAAADATPWGVLVRDRDGRLAAAATLLDDHGRFPRTTLAGCVDGHRVALPAVDDGAAALLAAALVDLLTLRRQQYAVDLGPLRLDGAAAALVAAVPPWLAVTRADPIPSLARVGAGDLAACVPAGQLRTLKKAHNRLATDGLDPVVSFTGEGELIRALMPQLAEAYRRRDHEHGFASILDGREGRARWSGRIERLLDAGRVELAALTLDGALAAYVLGLLDGQHYRVLEGRFVTAWSRYAPGRLLEAAVLQRVSDDPTFVGLDWMTGAAPETLLAANGAEEVVVIRGGRGRTP